MSWDGGTNYPQPGHDSDDTTTNLPYLEMSPDGDITPMRSGSHRASRAAHRGLAMVGVSAAVVGAVMLATTRFGGGFGQLLGEPGLRAVRVSPSQPDPGPASSSVAGHALASPSSGPTTGGPTGSRSTTPAVGPSGSVYSTRAARGTPRVGAPPSVASSAGTTSGAGTGSPDRTTSSAESSSEPSETTSSASTTPVVESDSLAQPVLDQLNEARAGAGLPALTMSAGLVRSAAKHTQLMVGGCGLAHQCKGEAGLGARISAEDVSWTAVGENIGDGGPVAASNAAIVGMAKQLTAAMLAEKAPNDGHRRNILSTAFHHIGISVYRDGKGTVWMTQDFAS